jgi:hypothetical protein
MAGREWGFWTREKLDILRRYLDAFTTACKGQREIIYLDLFSGEPENYDRLTRERVAGSPRIALETADPASLACASLSWNVTPTLSVKRWPASSRIATSRLPLETATIRSTVC